MDRKSCIVIGAGLSGLAAAYELTKARWRVIVLEARDRTGGRVRTFRFPEAPHLYCELGGEWVGRGHKHMKALCNEFGLEPLKRHAFDFSFLERGKINGPFKVGKWPFSTKAQIAFDTLRDEAKTWTPRAQEILDRKDWWTILRDRGFTRKELLRRDLMDSTDFGESIRQVGGFSAAAEYFSSNKNDEMDFRIKDGNIRLVDALRNKVTHRYGRVLLNQEVNVIRQDRQGVHVSTSRGRPHHAAFCICTVPARTLTKIKFIPSISDDQWDAAKQLQYARIMKTVLLFKERFWMENRTTKFSCFTDGPSDFIFDSTLYQEGASGILCSYAIGDKADDLNACSRQTLKALIDQDLRRIFPCAPAAAAIEAQPWQEDKYTQGAYALYRPGQWFGLRAILQEPHERVYFAGEHLAEEQGFMEGAVVTGQDAAANVREASGSSLMHRSPHPAIVSYSQMRRKPLS
jgi:monoamine oxidase